MNILRTLVNWHPCWRIIPSKFPPVGLFDRVTDPADLDAVMELESMTNDRVREEAGQLHLVAPEDRISGPGTTPIMAAFTHLNPQGSRFTDGSYGVFYTSKTLETAIEETRYHRTEFMRATLESPQELDMRVYTQNQDAELYDIRNRQATHPELYHISAYGSSQSFSRRLREAGSNGIVYSSVRHKGGENAAIFKPRPLSSCRQERHLCYVWDGIKISTVYEKRLLS